MIVRNESNLEDEPPVQVESWARLKTAHKYAPVVEQVDTRDFNLFPLVTRATRNRRECLRGNSQSRSWLNGEGEQRIPCQNQLLIVRRGYTPAA